MVPGDSRSVPSGATTYVFLGMILFDDVCVLYIVRSLPFGKKCSGRSTSKSYVALLKFLIYNK